MAKFEARGRHVRLPMEVRAEGEEVRVEGYAAVFDQEADIGGLFRERIARGAFADAIGRDDVVFLWNHDADTVMARTKSGTLTLEEDDRGLKMRATLDMTDPDVQRIYPKMKRGDVDKMSFAFYPEAEEWSDLDSDTPVRTIMRASLHDVSAVTHPAYDGTEIGLRSLMDHRKQHGPSSRAARRRIRMKMRSHPAFSRAG